MTGTTSDVARTVKYTVAYDTGEEILDLCKIFFGGDGSYYITAPDHPADRAIAAKTTVNYAKENDLLSFDQALEVATLDDDERRLKVSHHPDGFLQFSGDGIESGRDASGEPKGIGTLSWPLVEPTFGPSFQLVFSNPRLCGRPSTAGARTIVLPEAEIEHMRRDVEGLTIIGYYFPTPWREFVYRTPEGTWWINLLHPQARAMKPLRVLLASVDSEWAGFIGLEARPHSLQSATGEPSFFVTTSTGNLRRNEAGDLLGDQLVCVYPPPELERLNLSSLNFQLPEPPYTAPPGTTDIAPPPDARSPELG